MTTRLSLIAGRLAAICATVALLGLSPAHAQDRLRATAGYERAMQATQKIRQAQRAAMADVPNFTIWTPDSHAVEFSRGGTYYRYDLAARKVGQIDQLTAQQPGRRRGPNVERGRQVAFMVSPDKQHRAFYKNRNMWMGDAQGNNPVAVTTDGSVANRIKYGTASWVYGEELEQHTAFWWSPDSKMLAYYRFDESKVPDYFIAMNQTDIQDTLDTEPYPKAGAPNPVADLYIYNLATGKSIQVDARDGKPFDNNVVGYYVYGVRWSPDGKELLFNRTNRKQDAMDIAACDPATGHCRTVVHETWPSTWVENSPAVEFLEDGHRFLLTSERNGYKNVYLYDISGKLINAVTHHDFDVDSVVQVDESDGVIFYMANDGDNPMLTQLHRVGLDGQGDKRLTEPGLTHRISVSPDGKYFVDRAENHNTPPVVTLRDSAGMALDVLGKADPAALTTAGVPVAELLKFKSGDGKTDIYGMLYKPSNFDPAKKYPLIVSVYGGPQDNTVRENFGSGPSMTEFGFLVASFDGRGTEGRGKLFQDAIYTKMGIVEIDDQAAGVKYLRQRPYVDGTRVGIEGTSYGGYASAMCLLRYPDVFHAASASSPPTDWRNYDTIYTERYMGIPDTNAAAYDAGSAMTYASKLNGRLLIYYGSADNNVHPSNSMQLIAALQQAGKSFEVQVGPDQGHSGVNQNRMMEFFMDAFGMFGSH